MAAMTCGASTRHNRENAVAIISDIIRFEFNYGKTQRGIDDKDWVSRH